MPDPDPSSRGGSKKHRIPDPQHREAGFLPWLGSRQFPLLLSRLALPWSAASYEHVWCSVKKNFLYQQKRNFRHYSGRFFVLFRKGFAFFVKILALCFIFAWIVNFEAHLQNIAMIFAGNIVLYPQWIIAKGFIQPGLSPPKHLNPYRYRTK